MAADPMAHPTAEAVDRSFESRVGERGDLPAGVADQMVVMVSAWLDRFVARTATADLHPRDDAGAAEQVQGPVDACGADRTASPPEPIDDLLRTQTAGLGGEQLDHRRPCTAAAVPALLEGGTRELRPSGAFGSPSPHSPKHTGIDNDYHSR